MGALAECEYQARPPTAPTPHLPGTVEKVDVMERRVASGCSAFHPQDGFPASGADPEAVGFIVGQANGGRLACGALLKVLGIVRQGGFE